MTARTLSYDQTRALEADLSRAMRGEVRFSAGDRALYATGGSNYSELPIGVVLPRDIDDTLAGLEVCRQHGAPVLGRGGGTSLAGQACNVAVVFDFSKYVHHVLGLDPEARSARVQPGAVLDDLRDKAEEVREPIQPQYLMRVIDRIATDDAILATDSGTIATWAARHFDLRGEREFFLSGNLDGPDCRTRSPRSGHTRRGSALRSSVTAASRC